MGEILQNIQKRHHVYEIGIMYIYSKHLKAPFPVLYLNHAACEFVSPI